MFRLIFSYDDDTSVRLRLKRVGCLPENGVNVLMSLPTKRVRERGLFNTAAITTEP